MRKRYTIGIDIGTTGTKTALLDLDGRIAAVASRSVALHSPRVGAAEADPARWVSNIHESVREVLAQAGVHSGEVLALSTSGMVPAVIALDAESRPIRFAMLQNDSRATAEVREVAGATESADVLAKSGSSITQQSVGPKALWLRRNEPDAWRNTRTLVGSYDYALIALGAEPHVEQNWAIESGLFTIGGEPIPEVLAASGVEVGQLPRILRPGERAGGLSAAAAEATGLPVGTPLIVGGADHVLSAYAAGIAEPGDWLIKLGGAGDILAASNEMKIDERLYLDAHPVPGRWLPNGCMATSGSLIRWYQTLIGDVDVATLEREATDREPADLLCLPYFLGEKSPLHDPDLRGTFAGLHLGHTRGDLYRAVLEAIAFGFRHHTEVFRELGIPLQRALITNGGSKSTLWKQIHSEVLGTEVYPIIDHPGASLGAAILAGIGAGAIDATEPITRFSQVGEPVVPDPEKVRRYDEAYPLWRELGDSVEHISHRLARRAR